MKSILVAFILSFATVSNAQKTFEFDEGLCYYTGTFDSTKFTKIELQNTLEKIIFPTFIETNSTAWDFEEVSELDVNALEEECVNKLNELQTLDFADSEYFIQLKKDRIKELNETCRVQKLTIIAYEYPDTLMNFETDDEQVNFFRKGLIEGGDALVDAWIEVNRIKKSRNGYPENIQRKFNEQFNSPLKMEYAQLTVMMFGWWNHVNHILYEAPQEFPFREFEKLFSELKMECDY